MGGEGDGGGSEGSYTRQCVRHTAQLLPLPCPSGKQVLHWFILQFETHRMGGKCCIWPQPAGLGPSEMDILKSFCVILIGILGNTLWNGPFWTPTYLQYGTFLMFHNGSHIFVYFRQDRAGQDGCRDAVFRQCCRCPILPFMVWHGLVWYGLARYGLVWFGLVWFGLVWFGLVWFGIAYWAL